MNIARTAAAIVAVILVADCARTDHDSQTHDSVSVTFAQVGNIPTSAPLLDSTVLLDIGGVKDDEALELDPTTGSPRIELLSDSGVVVTDRLHVRFIDNAGRQRAMMGREGAGPGEFRDVQSICVTRGDTVVVYDSGNSRTTVLDANGHVALSHSTVTPGSNRACFDDGTFIALSAAPPPRDSQRLARVRLDGTLVNELGVFSKSTYTTNPWTEVSITAVDSVFLVADAAADDVRLYHRNGKLLNVLTFTDARNRSGATIQQPKPAPYLGWPRIGRVNQGRAFPVGPNRETWPVFKRAMLDADHNVWVMTHERSRAEPTIWSQYDWQGKLLTSFSLSAGLPGTSTRRPTQAAQLQLGGRDAVWSSTHDDDNALHYQKHALRRP